MSTTTTLLPTANGDEIAISAQYPSSGSHYDKVDEGSSYDGDSTRVYQSSATPYRDLYVFEDLPSGVGSIVSVAVKIICRQLAGTGGYYKTAIKTNGTVYDGTQITSTTTYTEYSTVYTTNPYTGNPWTISEVNALQAGVVLKSNGSNGTACTSVYVEVVWNPPTALGNVGIGSPLIF